MPSRSLTEWLAYVESLHPKTIAMGLERVARVRDAMGLRFDCPVIIVGGTNGKGSTCAMLEAILRAAGYRVGLYTSPHLVRYNERVRINCVDATDEQLAGAFQRVEAARTGAAQGTELTYFEFGTLAAAQLFADAKLDAVILEVGLGGRLDAVNIFDADVAIVASIGIDHTDYLGPTREHIGREKAGIFRAGRPAIVGDTDPPRSLLDYAAQIGADLRLIGRDFSYQMQEGQWRYRGPHAARSGLAYPALRGARQLDNASCVLAAIDALRERLPVSMQAVREGLALVELPGRFQVLPGQPLVILDVAHNEQAAVVLAQNLARLGLDARSYAVFGMLGDKDVEAVCRALKGAFAVWFVAALSGPRAAPVERLVAAIRAADPEAGVETFSDPRSAFVAAKERAGQDDRIVAFGSFLTVADIMASGLAGS